jgi:hypothetical protein
MINGKGIDDIEASHRLWLETALFTNSGVDILNSKFDLMEKEDQNGHEDIRLKSVERENLKLLEKFEKIEKNKKINLNLIKIENSQISKSRRNFENYSHQFNVFESGRSFITPPFSSDHSSILSEQMRCAFNELKRVNASLEEQLIVTGVSKQRILKQLKSKYLSLRASCLSKPSKYHPPAVSERDDSDPLTMNLRDMNQVWGATISSVPSLTGDPIHTDMTTWLSASMGYFSDECFRGALDVGGRIEAEEEAKLLLVLGAEVNRYRAICAALRYAIDDSRRAIDSDSDSLPAVLASACEIMKTRLGASVVTFWRMSKDGSSASGYTTADSGELNIRLSGGGGPAALFQRAIESRETAYYSSTDDGEVPMDISLIVSKFENLKNFESFSVSTAKGGGGAVTVIRDCDTDEPFHMFTAIYCEQFSRRLVASISPLQQKEVKKIIENRSLHLVECLFQLRRDSMGPAQTVRELVLPHMRTLFNVESVKLFITIEHNNQEILSISPNEVSESIDPRVPGLVDLSRFPDTFDREAEWRGIRIIPMESEIREICKNNSNLIKIEKSKIHSFIPFTGGGKNVTMILALVHAGDVTGGFDNQRAKNEKNFDYGKHLNLISNYLNLLNSILIEKSLISYKLEHIEEIAYIKRLLTNQK